MWFGVKVCCSRPLCALYVLLYVLWVSTSGAETRHPPPTPTILQLLQKLCCAGVCTAIISLPTKSNGRNFRGTCIIPNTRQQATTRKGGGGDAPDSPRVLRLDVRVDLADLLAILGQPLARDILFGTNLIGTKTQQPKKYWSHTYRNARRKKEKPLYAVRCKAASQRPSTRLRWNESIERRTNS